MHRDYQLQLLLRSYMRLFLAVAITEEGGNGKCGSQLIAYHLDHVRLDYKANQIATSLRVRRLTPLDHVPSAGCFDF